MKISIVPSDGRNDSSIRFDVSFDPESLSLSTTPFGTAITLREAVPTGEPGAPALPCRIVRVALPVGSEPRELAIRDAHTTLVRPGPVLVAPVQPARPGAKPVGPGRGPEDDLSGESRESVARRFRMLADRLREPQDVPRAPSPRFVPPREDLYHAELEKPRPVAAIIAIETRGANPIAVIQLNPVRMTRDGGIELVTRATVEVLLAPSGSTPSDRKSSSVRRLVARPLVSRAQAERTTELVRSIVINPDVVVDLGPIVAPIALSADYLIVTDNFRWDAAAIRRLDAISGDQVAEFTRLAQWKSLRGLRTRVVTVSQIVRGVFGDFRGGARDLQEVLRNFLKHAHTHWGVAWVVLGGDVDIIPPRRVVGFAAGEVGYSTTDPPEDNSAFWTGSFIKLHSGGHDANSLLLNAENGLTIPHDAAGTSSSSQRGWFFTTNDSYTTRSTSPTEFIRVNGPAAEIHGPLLFAADDNTIPTDFYYASLYGLLYGVPGMHDWDMSDNGVYGTHTDNGDADGVDYETDVSVGRVPVESAAEAKAWVDKIIAYEQFRRPDGTPLDTDWPRKMIIGAANWGGRIGVSMIALDPPPANFAHHPAGADHTLIHTADVLPVADWRLLVEVSATDIRTMPFNATASATSRGWRFARSATDLSASEIVFHLFGLTLRFAIPTPWVVVFGPAEELAPNSYIFDRSEADGSMRDQEELRVQIGNELPAINQFTRLYEDDIDLTPAQRAAAPVEHLTEAAMLARVNEGPHFVSLSGHGWWGGCCGYDTTTAETATNGFHSYIAYADSCSTSQFDVNDAVSERSLKNATGGAVAYVGNSRYSWIGVGDDFQRAFFHRLVSTRHLGLANDSRCAQLNQGTGFHRRYSKWAVFTLNLMGDPEMPVWLGPPRRLIAKYPRELDTRVPFQVRVSARAFLGLELPLPGAVVTLRQGGFFRQATTGVSGWASIDIQGASLGPMELLITSIGYTPVMDTLEVVGPAWVRGKVEAVWHQHVDPSCTYVRLALNSPLEGATLRGWFARKSLADYGVILDAVTDAYISEKEIALFVSSIKAGGTIEKFRFGLRTLVKVPPLNAIERAEILALSASGETESGNGDSPVDDLGIDSARDFVTIPPPVGIEEIPVRTEVGFESVPRPEAALPADDGITAEEPVLAEGGPIH